MNATGVYVAMGIVLILIILEYIYIKYNRTRYTLKFVLILIILEYIYMVSGCMLSVSLKSLNPYYTGIHLHETRIRYHIRPPHVLILIILEYIYIKMKTIDVLNEVCLNPYYTGIHLHILIIRLL